MVPKMWDKLLWESVWPYLDPWDSVRLRTASTHWNVPKKYGPHGELFLFLLKKEPMVLSELVEFGPCVSAERVKAWLRDWEVGRVALSCHLSMDLLCQEMRDACKGSSESLGSPRSLCSECLEERRRASDAQAPSFTERPGLQAGDSFEHFVPSSKRGLSFILFVWCASLFCV